MIGIIDYGMGNLRSVQKALELVAPDSQPTIVASASEISTCDKLILPGVGAFGDAMTHLRERGLVEPILDFVKTGKPFLGICLGLQLIFDSSTEEGTHAGLGLIPGTVERFELDDPTLKVPHMGWNALEIRQPDNPLLAGITTGDHVYFVHGYFAQPADPTVIAAEANYGGRFTASVQKDNIYAMQFHPEKSQKVGLQILKNFAEL